VILTRSRLCPGPKPGSSLHLHVLSTPPAFVLSQDQTLRKKCGVAGCQPQESCHVADSPPRTQCGGRHDGVIQPPPGAWWAGVGLEQRRTRALRRALLSFQRPLGGVDGSRRLHALLRPRKRPLVARGPIWDRRRLRLVMDSSLRGCSSREPLQERPRSIARDASKVERLTGRASAKDSPAKRRIREAGGARSAASRPAGRGRRAPPAARRASRQRGSRRRA
jgi:hypothetical protein